MVNVYNKEEIGGTGMNISFDEVLQKIESADDYEIEQIMDGAIDELIDALATADQAEKLKNAQ